MTWLPRRPLTILALVPVLGCGGSGNDSPTGPTSSTPPARCRTYATAFTSIVTLVSDSFSSTSTESESCQFDTATRILRCTVALSGGGCSTSIRSQTYATVADFVEEAEAVGRTRYSTWENISSGNCTASTSSRSFTYGPDKRPVRSVTENAGFRIDTTFTAWDALGRPTEASSISTGTSNCSRTESITYDDTARTETGRLNGCGSSSVGVAAYDAAGNPVNYVFTGGSTTFSRTSIVTATAAVCL